MDWIQSIKEIQKASENNRLVVFVGSGVSANSDIPTWNSLIVEFAKKLSYDNCGHCSNHNEACPTANCEYRYKFNQNEFLLIPEYFYLQDGPEKKEYFDLIRNTLSCDKRANPINDAIFKILPHHVITTNYDPLLERSKEVNALLYSVIYQDKDILSNNNTHYIIKMHGDLEYPQSIVLRESDYIEYEQTHTLISTFIKSLLLDHTFLFIGYSLNDYNLKLIIGWINYFVRLHGIENRPYNFIIQHENVLQYEAERLRNNNIFVIDTCKIPTDIFNTIPVPSELKDIRGKMMYVYLNGIFNSEMYQNYLSLSDILYEKYAILDKYNKISYEDLIRTYPLGGTELRGQHLCFFDENWYNRIKNIILGDSIKDKFIKGILKKARIKDIYYYWCKEFISIDSDENIEDSLFSLYLDNRYFDLEDRLKGCNNLEKAYYSSILYTDLSIAESLLKIEEIRQTLDDYISIIIYKINIRSLQLRKHLGTEIETKEIEAIFRTVPSIYKKSIGYIEKIFHSLSENYSILERLLAEHEKRFSFENNTMYSDHCFVNVMKLQAYAYEFYYFFKENFIMLDYFSEPKDYLKYYLKSILCTYTPVRSKQIRAVHEPEQYPLGVIDIDMFVKFTRPKDLQTWIYNYKVRKLQIQDDVNIVTKFSSLCGSFLVYWNTHLEEQLYNFIILVSRVSLGKIELEEMAIAFIKLIEEIADRYPHLICNYFPFIKMFLLEVMSFEQRIYIDKIISIISKANIFISIMERYEYKFDKMIRELESYISMQTIENICNEIKLLDDDWLRLKYIYIFRAIIPMEEYKPIIVKNMKRIGGNKLMSLVDEGYISYDEGILDYYIDVMSSVINLREKTGAYSEPDHLLEAIESCIILKLLGKPIEISRLEPYKDYSVFLEFILNPESFDYSKVDTNHYMWVNFFRSKEYAPFLKMHKDELLTDNLNDLFSTGHATRDQQKIVYGVLLEQDELWEYPQQTYF